MMYFLLLGGIDRIVGTLNAALTENAGFKSVLLYFDKTANEQTAPFEQRIAIDTVRTEDQLTEIIDEHGIEHIIVSTAIKRHTWLVLPAAKSAAEKQHITVYFWFHGRPGYEMAPLDVRVALFRIMHRNGKWANLKKLIITQLSSFRATKTAYIQGTKTQIRFFLPLCR